MTLTPASFPPGSQLADGKYRIVDFLGAGGMGAVFEAEHTLTGKRVAIKCVELSGAPNDPAAQRLLREARLAARIRHPNVVDIYDVIRGEGLLGLVMERLWGEPLSLLMASGRLPVERALALLLPVMRGVAAAHRVGVIHRDIKPANIFLAREEDAREPVPKLLDFGIAKLGLHDLESSALTRSGQFVGTPLYMSLEQFKAEIDIDERADVYSLGVVLYQALTGQLPFVSATVPGLIVKLTTTTPVPPALVCSDISDTLSDVVLRAIARERDDRIPSVDALLAAVEAGLGSREPALARLGPAPVAGAIHASERPRGAISQLTPGPQRVRPLRWVAALALVGALGGALFVARAGTHRAVAPAISPATATSASSGAAVGTPSAAAVAPTRAASAAVSPALARSPEAPDAPAPPPVVAPALLVLPAQPSAQIRSTRPRVRTRDSAPVAPPLAVPPTAPSASVPERVATPEQTHEKPASKLRFEAPTSQEF